MGKIILLDDLTSSQIAAGEVVERPASVVKEMVENSIDAGSTRISVEIRNGGIKYIRIDDNGCGMEPDDCIIAFDKHATSKIRSSEDLFSINTLGFRGEALASIAAVSKVTLRTKTRDSENGTLVVIEGGDLVESGPCGAKDGTSFTVENLFYNTPARYKFLMKDRTEASYVAEVMERIALSHPSISFRLISDKNQILYTPGGTLKDAVYGLYGREVAEKLVPCGFYEGAVKVTGLCGMKELTYGNRNRQMAFVNGRFVKSKTVSAAIDEAYKTLTMKGRFPFVILNIELPPTRVDVNVHPAKTEVRFADNNAVFRTVFHAISSAIYEREVQPPEFSGASGLMPGDLPFESIDAKGTLESTASEPETVSDNYFMLEKDDKNDNSGITGENVKDVGNTGESTENNDADIIANYLRPVVDNADTAEPQQEDSDDRAPGSLISKYFELKGEEPLGQKEQSALPGLERPQKSGKQDQEKNRDPQFSQECIEVYKNGRVIGQLLETYILIEYDGAFYMVDQHAAHERLKYEEIRSRLEGAENPSVQMLLPVAVRLGASEMLRFREILPALEMLGFEIDEFGNDTVIIRSIPTLIDESVAESFVVTAIGSPRTGEGMTNVFPDNAVYTMACKAAIKGNMKLSDVEIRYLLDSLANVKNPGTCPHGRPIIFKMTQYEIERRFHRA